MMDQILWDMEGCHALWSVSLSCGLDGKVHDRGTVYPDYRRCHRTGRTEHFRAVLCRLVRER